MNGATLIAECLKFQGAEHMFGIVGIPVIPIAVMAQATGINYIGMRNEQAASYAAGAVGYLTQKPGICLAVSGPGMIHCIAGLANAWSNCWPMILIAGANDTDQNGMGAFQEAPQIESARPYVKYAARVHSADRIPFFIEQAYRASIYGRPGPVYLDIPGDVINAETQFNLAHLTKTPSPPIITADSASIREAIKLLSSAKKPLIIIGKGAAYARAEDEVNKFVNSTKIPFLATPMGKGVVSDLHPNSVAAARTDALLNAEVILLIGARLNWILHFGLPPRFSSDVKFIQIDICAEELSNNVRASVNLVGDARAVVHQLNDEYSKHPFTFPSNAPWIEFLQTKSIANKRVAESQMKDDTVPMNYYRAIREVYDNIPSDSMIISEGANTMDISRSILLNTLPRHRLDAGTFGTMGVGSGFCIAASAVCPSSKIVAVQGDSAFGFSAMELEVAFRYKMPMVIVIINNNGIYEGVSEFVDGCPPPPNCLTPSAHYEKFAEAFGGKGYFVTTPSELKVAIIDALKQPLPCIVNVMIELQGKRKAQKFDWLTRKDESKL